MVVDESLLHRLMERFLEENQKLNLSAFRTSELCWPGNILDSIAILQHMQSMVELREAKTITDIGTGGGFPLLPLAACLPDVRCTGIDATQKKVDAVRKIAFDLGLKNVNVISGRIESIAHSADHRGKSDLVTARAVAPIAVLLEYAAPLLKVGGIAALWKSTKFADELAGSANAQKLLACPFYGTFSYTLPDAWGERTIVFFKKIAETSDEYPRRTGMPKQKPL